MKFQESLLVTSSKSLLKFLDDKPRRPKKSRSHVELQEEIIQHTDLVVDFVMKEFSFVIYKPKSPSTTPSSEYRTPVEEVQSLSLKPRSPSIVDEDQDNIISFVVKQLEMSMVQRTYDMKVSLKYVYICIYYISNN